MKRLRKSVSIILCIALIISMLNSFAFAQEADLARTESTTVKLASGEEITYVFEYGEDSVVVSGWNSEGILVEKSAVSEGVVVQQISNGETDNRTYKLTDIVTQGSLPADELSVMGFGSDSQATPLSIRPWYDPPLQNDSGLVESPFFFGYKYLGQTGRDSIYQISINVHRKIEKSLGEAYDFTASPGTTVATIASVIAACFGGAIIAGIALALAIAFVGVGIDAITKGKVTYEQIHYTYKYTVNEDSTCVSKDCECRQWWIVYRNGEEVGREEKIWEHLTIFQ